MAIINAALDRQTLQTSSPVMGKQRRAVFVCMINKGSLGKGEDINYISKSFHIVNLKLLYNYILNT